VRISRARRFVSLLFALTACTQQSTSPGLTLRIGAVGPIDLLVPQQQGGYSTLVKGLVFPLLLEPTTEGEWHPRLVSQSARLAPNRYRLKLDPSVQFSDGSPARNEDLIASVAAFGLRGIERDGWVEVEPMNVEAPIDVLLASAVLFKQSPQGFLGTGSFFVVAQDTSRLQLRRIKPLQARITDVEMLSFATPRDAFARAMLGEVNVLMMPDSGQIELLQGIPRFRLIRGQGVQGLAAVFNTQRLSRDERKALAAAILADPITTVHGTNCELNVPPSAQGRLPPGAPLELHIVDSDAEIARAGIALRRALGARGGPIFFEPPSSIIRRAAEGLFEIIVGQVAVWPPRRAAWAWHTQSSWNRFGYSNPALDEALYAGDYARAERELRDDPPALLLCRPERTMAIDARVKNPRLGVYDMLESLPDWEVNP